MSQLEGNTPVDDAGLPYLYSFRRCPYAMRARLALQSSGVIYEHREVLLRDKPQAMLDTSPKGTVPVFVTHDGVIDESIDIMRWALAKNDPEGWLLRVDEDRIAVFDGPFKQALDRYKYATRYKTDPVEHRAIAADILSSLNSQLDDRTGLADIATFPFVRQFANTDRAWFDAQPWTKVHSWLSDHLNHPRFAAIMHKHAVWQPSLAHDAQSPQD